ncbi:DUF6632 domain-containing protein [Ideonella azotifigens]|uniref:DUF6632 domain-containing protein n=1 Tax=Ideonella azotifigens TaxID=513160 RepID=UPI00287321EF|nr:DUF6632 domain-containing protein [Ideonella azotifigens]
MLTFGLIFIFGVYPLTVLWPAGWAWHHGHSEYIEMIIALYATLGVFLLIASRNPVQHLSLIAFTIWSSIVHAAVMAVQATANPMHTGHLLGDVPALFIVALVLGWLCPAAFRLPFDRGAR